MKCEADWQDEEDARLEYEGYCKKIKQGLEALDSNSGFRAIWELVQNARDQSSCAEIQMKLSKDCFVFSHHGTPFDYTSFRSLVKQDSSKNSDNAETAGEYGTGFMTTHVFNRNVYVSAPYAVRKSKDIISGYVQIENFSIDRSQIGTEKGPIIMGQQLEDVKQFRDKRPLLDSVADDTTSFRYELDDQQIPQVSSYLAEAIRLMPIVMILNKTIKRIDIDDEYRRQSYSFMREGEEEGKALKDEDWHEVKECVSVVDNVDNSKNELCRCTSLKSVRGDVVVIPPVPAFCGDVETIPSLFLWFPLLGTEHFGVNFIFHSQRFFPVEKRNSIMLPGASGLSEEKGEENEKVLKEMMEALFEYYSEADNAKELTRKMCTVAFPKDSDNEEAQAFYSSLQNLWSEAVSYWKVLPIEGKFYCVNDESVRLLHPSFYSNLDNKDREKYERVIEKYAKAVRLPDGSFVKMPDEDLIAWSETVNNWRRTENEGHLLTINQVCETIKERGEDLHDFLMMLKVGENVKLIESYPLLPNREGGLCKRAALVYGDFMDEGVYELVKDVMGDNANKMFDPYYRDVCTVGDYTKDELQKDISNTIGTWREFYLNSGNLRFLEKDLLDALIRFCSASYALDLTNYRGRVMRVLVEYYKKEFEPVLTIRFREEDEEEFYKPAFNFLLDYTLKSISEIEDKTKWLGDEENREWLFRFMKEYAPDQNEDRCKKLDNYAVLPNRNNVFCLRSNLKKNVGVPSEMVEIYNEVLGVDLNNVWLAQEFEPLLLMPESKPEDISQEIEKLLIEDMKKESDRMFEKVVRRIIIKVCTSKEWATWFEAIDEKKATYTFSMQSGENQKNLFSLMDNLSDSQLARLAKLGEESIWENLLKRMEDFQQVELDKNARFHHLEKIGKHIEDTLRDQINKEAVKLEMPRTVEEFLAADVQNGQDILVKVRLGAEWRTAFYVEVKSKWDFSKDSAHMSSSQIRTAVQHKDEYALCCVDLRPYKNENLEGIERDKIIQATRVKLTIGESLSQMMDAIMEADNKPDEEQIKISDYRSNMSAKVFSEGEPFDVLLKRIQDKVERLMADSSSGL